jgi:hypothetical protein
MPRGKTNNSTPTEKPKRGRPRKAAPAAPEAAPKKRGRPRKTQEEAPAAAVEKKAERRASITRTGPRQLVRPITDTVGIAFILRQEDEPPKEGGTVHVTTEKGEEFDLRISKVHKKKHGGYTVWTWLRPEAKDGPRFRACRLQSATIIY